ncbi:MAG: HEAT repeat domain-containing protein [Thermodesulfobacteriota bacterium]
MDQAKPKVKNLKKMLVTAEVLNVEESLDLATIIQATKHEDTRIRRASVYLLGELKDLKALGPLCEALEDQDRVVGRIAARALGKLEDPQVIEPLSKFLVKVADNSDMRCVVVCSISRVARKAGPGVLDQVPGLQAYFTHHCLNVQKVYASLH